jgi:hypothetical protein
MFRIPIAPCTIKRAYNIFKVGSANSAFGATEGESVPLEHWYLSTKIDGETSHRTAVFIFIPREPHT